MLGLLAVALGIALPAQEPLRDTMTVVTGEWPLRLHAWKPGSSGLEKVWAAKPREVDPATWQKRRGDVIGYPRSTAPVIADLDGDGLNELLVMDSLGITVYGRNPAYYPFERASALQAPAPLVVADVDGDARPELITLRGSDVEDLGVEIFKLAGTALQSVWKQPGVRGFIPSYVLAVGDADNDGAPEILAGATVCVFKRRADTTWEQAAVLPNLGNLVDDARVADVDGDGKNEVVLGGNGGKVTVHRYRKYGERLDGYPVVWQSRSLLPEGMKGITQSARANSYVAGVEVADVDADGKPEILAATSNSGIVGDRKILGGGRLHVFQLDGASDFKQVWASDFTKRASVHTLHAGDIDGDGAAEIVFNGSVFEREANGEGYRLSSSLGDGWTAAAVGKLGELREPAAALRLVPLYWTAGREMGEGEIQDVRFTLFAPWAGAKDVTVTVTSANDRISVAGGSLQVPELPAGSAVETPAFTLTAHAGEAPVMLEAQVVAAGGYRQIVPLPLRIGSPFPSYAADVQSSIAAALAQAKDDNRRVLIQWGSGADRASQNLTRVLKKSPAVARTLQYEYVVVRADLKGNARAAARYKVPVSGSVPALTVLDADGRVLANQPAAPFATGGENAAAFDAVKLDEFLTKFKPAYVEAEPRLKEAIGAAKREHKTLFAWFSAPW
jgi:hypothetical protein